MSRPSSGHAAGTPSVRGSGPPQQRPSSQQQQQRNAVPGAASPRTSASTQQGASPSPASKAPVAAGQPPATKVGQRQATGSEGAAHGLAGDLEALVSKPVRLTLDEGLSHEVGLLWAYDIGMGIVALEVPKAALGGVGDASSVQEHYPSMAATYPTAMLSTVKVAAQGGDTSGSRTNFNIIQLRKVQRVEPLQSSSSSSEGKGSSLASAMQALANAQPTPVERDVNVAAAEARERAATGEALKRAAKIGKGVSKLGQDVFDALNKTLPCRWVDRHIIVMDEIVVSPDNYDTAVIPDIPLSTLQTLADGGSVSNAPHDAKAKATRWQRVSKVLAGERKRLLS